MKVKPFYVALIALIPEIFTIDFPACKSKNRVFVKRDLQEYLSNDGDQCNANPEDDVFFRFNAVFFGDFTSQSFSSIEGPLAVGGSLATSPYYGSIAMRANLYGDPDCSNLGTSFAGYGLVVGGSAANANAIQVHGAAFLPADGNLAQVTEIGSTCPVTNSMGTGSFDFNVVQTDAISTSMQLSLYPPSLYLDSNNNLMTVGPKTNGYDVISMNTCNTGNCPLWPGLMSDPDFLFAGFGWDGPQGRSWPSKLIINIPVDVGGEIYFLASDPFIGMNICGTIFNIYPSSSDGSYSGGDFTLFLGTSNFLSGFILMPEATIIKGAGSGIAGQVFAKNFLAQGTNGINIAGYRNPHGNPHAQCDYFNACVTETPIETRTFTVTASTTTTSTTYSASTTVTGSATVTVTYSAITTITTTSTANAATQTIIVDGKTLTTTVIVPNYTDDHKHHHHTTTTGYDCEHESHNNGPVLFCEYDNHHHHKLDEDMKYEDDYHRKTDDDDYDDTEWDDDCDEDH